MLKDIIFAVKTFLFFVANKIQQKRFFKLIRSNLTPLWSSDMDFRSLLYKTITATATTITIMIIINSFIGHKSSHKIH